jgi:hypothetical protein
MHATGIEGNQQQILRTIDFWQLSRAAGQQVPGPSAQLLDFLAHHPYWPSSDVTGCLLTPVTSLAFS